MSNSQDSPVEDTLDSEGQNSAVDEGISEDFIKAAQNKSKTNIVETSNNKEHGLDKCPKCGSSEIVYNQSSHSLQCEFCRAEWNEGNADEAFGFDDNLRNLRGVTTASGAQKIASNEAMVTIKCQGCGAEIVVDSSNTLQARCHWCRQTLSITSQIPNGAVPDSILPFKLTHEQAVANIAEFANKRKFFAWKKFKEEFTPENVVGVFMPYMMIDGNMSAQLAGKGEKLIRRYTVTVGSGDNKRTETRYDADLYEVYRSFNMTVDDLTTESSSERSVMNNKINTNNILNAILPFDTKNAVTFNTNYMKGYTSEKRDLDVEDIDDRVTDQFKSISRAQVVPTLGKFDRGVKWEYEDVDVHGTRWVTAYLPVWLYSYYVDKGDGDSFVHYIAVNGRTGETMGSIPVSHIKLAIASTVAAGVGFGISIPIFLGSL